MALYSPGTIILVLCYDNWYPSYCENSQTQQIAGTNPVSQAKCGWYPSFCENSQNSAGTNPISHKLSLAGTHPASQTSAISKLFIPYTN